MITVADVLGDVRERLPPCLFSPATYERLLPLASVLPTWLSREYLAEIELHDDAALADLSLSIVRGSVACAMLASPVPPETSLGRLATAPAWRAVLRFGAAWRDEPGLNRAIPGVWLEFDASRSKGAALLPSVYATLGAECQDAAAASTTIARTMALWQGAPLSRDAVEAIESLVAARPDTARVFQFGCMLARDTAATRLCIGPFVDWSELDSYLGRIRWPGHRARLAQQCRPYATAARHMTLTLDTADTVAPQVGIELHFRDQPPHDSGWASALDRLHTAGHCTASKRDALLQLAARARQIAEYPPIPEQALSHLKLHRAGDETLTAKAYFHPAQSLAMRATQARWWPE